MFKLTDTQAILLSCASQRDGGSLLPLPDTVRPGGGTAKAVTALLKRGLAEEREFSDPATARRVEGDTHYGVFITAAGATAIGVDLERADDCADAGTTIAASAPSSAPRASSKTAAVITLLTRPDGATLPELIEATGWLPHTTRAALTGIRKKGHEIARGKRDGATCYRIVAAA